MKAVLFALLMLVPGVAWADDFDGKKASEYWYAANVECRQGENQKGETVSVDQSERQCDRREILTILLETHRYCFDTSEQEWAVCH